MAATVLNLTTTIFPYPPGQHPHLLTTLSLNLTIHPSGGTATNSCSLALFFSSIPSSLFLDVYQLATLHTSDAVRKVVKGPKGGEVEGARYWGEEDLEKPVVALTLGQQRRGGAVVVPIWKRGKGKGRARDDVEGSEQPREPVNEEIRLEVDLPLHARYLRPVPQRQASSDEEANHNRLDIVKVDITPPRAVWFCDRASSELPPWSPTPLRLLNLASIPRLPPELSLYDLHPTSEPSEEALAPSEPPSISLPTGVISDLRLVEPVTVATVWICAVFLVFKGWNKRSALQREKQKTA